MSTSITPTTQLVGHNTPALPRVATAQRAGRVVWWLSGLNLAIVVAVLLLIFVVSERWWIAAAISYLPRSPWALPAVILTVAACRLHRPSVWVNVVTLGLVAGPMMELRVPGVLNAPSQAVASTGRETLRVVSCNVQSYKPNFAEVLQETTAAHPDVVLFQEAFGDNALLKDFFPDWHKLHVSTYWVGSRYPLRLVAECPSQVFDRISGIVVEVDAPGGPVMVANIHQMTARRGLQAIHKGSLLSGNAAEDVDGFRALREFESAEIRHTIDAHRGDRALIVAGDFNTPTSSNVFHETWGDLQSAFDVAGFGYGYTSPCKPHRYWPPYVPWARIDHVLCSSHWTIAGCSTGRRNGSDHRLITAELRR
jgi:endonuclease/exonuclease/phosphatase (EEP) superfamily protein YafD